MSIEINDQDNSEFKSFKKLTSTDKLDFDNMELIRGETPKDIKEKCLQLCRDYLSGNWSEQTVDTIEIRRVTGGFVNQIYYCGIKEANNNLGVSQEVAVRLYGEVLFGGEDIGRIRDVVISLMFSEHKLGAKIYGLFESGQIQKFYKHRSFYGKEQKNPALLREVIRKLAEIHSLDVPIKKDPQCLFKQVTNWYTEALEKFPIKQRSKEYNCETLKNCDFKAEFNWFKGVIEKVKSPVMFTHNDFRSSNLMITEPNDEIVVCDYDMSCYGYRGYDFIPLFREWGRYPFEMRSIEGLPLDQQFRPVIEIYVEECQRIHGKCYSENEINSVDHILKEVKTFLLFSFLMFSIIFLKNDVPNSDFPMSREVLRDFVDSNIKNYFEVKEILKQQKIID